MKGRGTAVLLGVVLAAFAGVLSLAVAPASGGGAQAARTKQVAVRDNFFSPRTVGIARGDSVRWSWKGQLRHNVRFRKVPRGASKKPGARTKRRGSLTRRFTRRGKYRYVCTIHDGMTGTVNVR